MAPQGSLNIGVVGVSDGWSSKRLTEAVRKKTGSAVFIEMDKVGVDITTGEVFFGDLNLASLDALIIKKVGAAYSYSLIDRMEILRFLHSRGVRIFSPPAGIMKAMDRLSCTLTLRGGDIPMPPTVVTESIDVATKAVSDFGRAVCKPIYTSKARGMRVIEAGNGVRDAVRDFQAEGNALMYIQKMIDLPGQDLGLVYLGGEYVATYARVGSGESWNTTTRSGGKYQPYEPSPEVIELGRRAQSLFGLDFTCVDIAEIESGPVVFEVSAFGGFRGLKEAHSIDAAAMYVDYVLKQLEGVTA